MCSQTKTHRGVNLAIHIFICCLLACLVDTTDSAQGHIQLDEPLRNLSRHVGDIIRIRCEITGDPIPRYTWYKDGVPVADLPQDEASRINARATPWGSRLKISTLTFDDAGLYMCTGTNPFGESSVTGALTVLPRTKSSKKYRNRDQDRASDEDLEPDSLDIDDVYSSRADPHFKPVDPIHSYGRRHGGSTGVINEEIEDSEEGFCQPYRGYACSKHISSKNIFVKNKLQQSQVEESVTIAVTVIASSTELSQRCGQYIIPSLCYFSFPLCDDLSPQPRARFMCREECEMLETDYCMTEYLLARSRRFGNGQFVLPNCAELPFPGTAAAQNCLSIGLPRPSGNKGHPGEGQHRCYNGTGETYRGMVSITKSGYTCQMWSSQTPHAHYFRQYPGIGDHNYCRNPGNSEDSPWCYTMNNLVSKEACEIPRCVAYAAKRPDEPQRKIDGVLMTLIPSIAIPIGIILLIIVICVCRRRHKHQRNGVEKPKKPQEGQQLEMSAMLAKVPEHACEFPMSSIRFTREIGEGSLGKVYRGQLIGYYRGNSVTEVIIKTLKSNAAPKMQNDFRHEIELKTSLKHANVLSLLGVCVKEEPICMVFEYMLHGDLHDYLIVHSPHSDVPVPSGQRHILDHNDMMHFAVQAACGMEYLASCSYVHRDVATRNILIGNNLAVKICDFGVTQTGYSADYYKINGDTPQPVRWMPPEAIVYGKLGVESDVWSFGVVLWEIYSYGTQPYFGYSNLEVMQMVRAHQVLPCPAECPAQVYALMVDCWNEMPQRRPRFTKIHSQLRLWKTEIQTHANRQYNIGHSNSSQNSGQASQPSSSAPSNNTGVTAMTTGGNNYTPEQPPAYFNFINRQPPHALSPLPPQPVTPYYSHQGAPQNMCVRPSPPASATSHKSSSASQGSGSYQNDFKNKVTRNNITNCNISDKYGSKLNSPMSDSAADGYIPGVRTSNL